MKKRLMGIGFGLVVGVVVLACSAIVLAQTAQAQAIPRTTDGKPDLSGTWFGGGRTTGGQAAGQMRGKGTMELTKWGRDKFNWNRAPEAANAPGVYRGQHVRVDQDPLYHCYPAGLVRLGPPRYVIIGGSGAGPALIEILQTPSKVTLLFNYQHEVRQIFTDGRGHPKNLELTWNGHSIGRWDGDTLVVDTIGIRDESWLDTGGHEHSTQLHVVERFRRVDAETLEIERTLTDPIALAKPFTTTVSLKLSPDRDMDENIDGVYDCTQFMMRKSAFGEGVGGVMGISEPPAEE